MSYYITQRTMFNILCSVSQSCPTLCCSPSGSSVHGILQARIWSGLPWPPSGNLRDPGIKPSSLMSPALIGRWVLYH